MRSLLSGWVAAILVAGCGCNGKDTAKPDTDTDGADIDDVAIEVLPMPTALEVTWTSDQAGTGFVEYGIGDAFDRVSAEQTDGTDHAVTLVLLRANTTYKVRAVTELADGTRLESAPVELKIAPPPQGMPILSAEVLDAEATELTDGYVLTAFLGQASSYVGIMDGEAKWVWWAEMDAPDLSSVRARLSRDGRSVLYNLYQTDRKDDQGWIVRLGLDGREEIRTRTLLAHHDFVELPEGGFGWLGYDQRDVDVTGTPADEDLVATHGDGPYPVATDVVFEGPEGMLEGEEPDYVWGFFDDYVADPWWVCTNMENKGEFVPDYFEWTHSNSIAYIEEEDAYYVMARYLDALLKIDRATGSLIWQLGGENATMTFAPGSEPFNHGHVSDIWDGGMLMFDNRDHAGAPSRVVEYSWDEGTGIAQVEWEFPRPDNELLTLLGDARKLPGGNRLVAWSQFGEMAEVTPEGEVVRRTTISGMSGIMTRVIYFTEADIGAL